MKRLGTSLRGRIASHGRLGCLNPGSIDVHSPRLFEEPDTALDDVGLNLPSPNINFYSITRTNKRITRALSTDPTSDTEPVSI